MHVLILHNSHSTTDWGSAQHSVSEGRKLKHNKHMASDLGNLQPRSRGFSAFLKKRTTALCWHNPPAELCSPVLQGLWVSAGSMGWAGCVSQGQRAGCSWEQEFQESGVTGVLRDSSTLRSPLLTLPEMSPEVDQKINLLQFCEHLLQSQKCLWFVCQLHTRWQLPVFKQNR